MPTPHPAPTAAVAPEAPIENHRVRVGAQRRERTRLRLLESALTVFTETGPDQAVIEDFILAAGVSRGTFYNHFRSPLDLLLALAGGMSDEVLAAVDPFVLNLIDPVERFCTGARLYMRVALQYPLWGSFITRVGTRIATRSQLIDRYLCRDLGAAMAQGRIRIDHVSVGRDLVMGVVFYGVETLLTEPTQACHPEQLMCCVLIGLGVDADEARRLAFAPLPQMQAVEGPIFSRLKPLALPLTHPLAPPPQA
ncbi:MAG: TetR/AcrR family transcriptional regulator [Leptothrix sp. (in: b-proteobacteria)]